MFLCQPARPFSKINEERFEIGDFHRYAEVVPAIFQLNIVLEGSFGDIFTRALMPNPTKPTMAMATADH